VFVKTSLLLSAMFMIPLSLFAARPFATDDAGTVEPGIFEIESALDYWKDRASFGIGLKHGLTSKMDLGIALGYTIRPEDEMAASPLGLSFKYNFIPEHFSVSISGSFNSAVYAINTIYTHPFNVIAISINIGLEVTESIKECMLTHGVLSTFLFKNVTVGFEIAGTHKNFSLWQVGTQISIKDWLAIDVGFGGDFEKEIQLNATTGLWVSLPVSKL